MIEQWVIDRLDPLKGEKLIILADPQRMIRVGARAVDEWANENGFTVLFCSGNLALREMYENVRMANPLTAVSYRGSRRMAIAYCGNTVSARPNHTGA